MYYAFDGAEPPAWAGSSHATIYPYGPFPVGDGDTIMLGLQNEREWALFCERVLRQPDLLEDDRFNSNATRSANRQELRAIIVESFAGLGIQEVVNRLDQAPIANAKVNDMHAVWKHPQLQARKRWVDVSSPKGPLPALLPPGVNSAFKPRMDAIPALGEHSESILCELGYSLSDIEQFKTAGAI